MTERINMDVENIMKSMMNKYNYSDRKDFQNALMDYDEQPKDVQSDFRCILEHVEVGYSFIKKDFSLKKSLSREEMIILNELISEYFQS